MKSLIILLVDNGKDTDELERVVAAASDVSDVLDWTVRVDIGQGGHEYTFVHTDDDMIVGKRSRDRSVLEQGR